MALLQALLAFIGRSAGKILNTAFGWATVLLFGKVSEDKQAYLSVIAFGSVAWLVAVLGILFPSVGTFLFAFVTLPDWVNPNWMRLAMLLVAVVIPPVLGAVSLRMLDPEDRPPKDQKLKAILRGYPYALGVSITLLMLLIVAPFQKARALTRRWTTEHMPLMVESEDYLGIANQLAGALEAEGLKVRCHQASWMLRYPLKVVTTLAGGAVHDLVADNLTTLEWDRGEIVLYPSDVLISGSKEDVARTREALVEPLSFAKAYMTWSKDANEIEDCLSELWHHLEGQPDGSASGRVREGLREVERRLKSLPIPYEEWEVLFREKLLLERRLLRAEGAQREEPRETRPARMPTERAVPGPA